LNHCNTAANHGQRSKAGPTSIDTRSQQEL
jgi:hypothetical protein